MTLRARCLNCGEYRDIPDEYDNPVLAYQAFPFAEHKCSPNLVKYELIEERRSKL